MKRTAGIGFVLVVHLLFTTRIARAASDPVRAAFAWLGAVHDKDEKKLAERTRFPFVMGGHVLSASRAKTCSAQAKAQDAAGFATVASCVINDPLFSESAPAGPAEHYFAEWKQLTSLDKLPKKMRRFKKTLAPLARDHVFVGGPIIGDGINYDVIMAIAPDGRVSAIVAESEVYE